MIFSNLNYLIKKNNVNQKSIIDTTRITRPTLLQLIRNDTSGIKFETIDKLCDFFDIPIGELLIKSAVDIEYIASKLEFDKELILQTQGEIESFVLEVTFKFNDIEYKFKGEHVYNTLGEELEFVNYEHIEMICYIELNDYNNFNKNNDLNQVLDLYIFNFDIREKIANDTDLSNHFIEKLIFKFEVIKDIPNDNESLFDDFINSLNEEQRNKFIKLIEKDKED